MLGSLSSSMFLFQCDVIPGPELPHSPQHQGNEESDPEHSNVSWQGLWNGLPIKLHTDQYFSDNNGRTYPSLLAKPLDIATNWTAHRLFGLNSLWWKGKNVFFWGERGEWDGAGFANWTAHTVWHEILRVLIFAIFSTICPKKFPPKIIPCKKNFRKNLLHYWNYQDHYLMQKCICVYLFKSPLSFKNKTIEL